MAAKVKSHMGVGSKAWSLSRRESGSQVGVHMVEVTQCQVSERLRAPGDITELIARCPISKSTLTISWTVPNTPAPGQPPALGVLANTS